jgi:glycine/D-amino acid oxidase-like deaminating enzyme
MSWIIVVGGGLSGLSAAHTVLERGGNVVVIDKTSFFGGNSTKGAFPFFRQRDSLLRRTLAALVLGFVPFAREI